MRYLPLLWAGLFRKKTRTILTLLSVIVAFLLLGLLHAVKVAFESGAESADAKRLLTTARYSIIEPLPIAHLRPIERVGFLKGYAEKAYKNLIQGGSGAFGNTATRLEAFVAKGGTFVYGNYPDLDALFLQQAKELDSKRREAILHRMQHAGAEAADQLGDPSQG